MSSDGTMWRELPQESELLDFGDHSASYGVHSNRRLWSSLLLVLMAARCSLCQPHEEKRALEKVGDQCIEPAFPCLSFLLRISTPILTQISNKNFTNQDVTRNNQKPSEYF